MNAYDDNFYYTDYRTKIDSTLVSEAYYNAGLRELAVVLTNGQGYVYYGVPKEEFEGLLSGGFWSSPGRVYNKNIKRVYGPGTPLGYVGDFSDVFVWANTIPATAAATGAGMPKNLVYADDAKVSENVTSTSSSHDAQRFDLIVGGVYDLIMGGVDAEALKHEVVFTVGDDDTEKTYTTQAGSVTEAVAALLGVADMLDLTFTPKRVVVHL